MSDPSSINYQPLEQIDSAWNKVARASLQGYGLAVTILVVLVCVALSFGTKSPSPVLYAALGYSAFISYRVNKFKNRVWQEFASANGWGLDAETQTSDVIPPSLQFGHSRKFSPIIQAKLGDLPCDLLTYNCTTGSGKYSQTHYFTVALTDLPKAMPHIVLHNKQAAADLEDDLGDDETLKLEGDFNDYFKLQVERGQEVDVLAVLTPDVMQTLVDYNQNEDIEILGSNLYFIMRGDDRGSASVQQLIRSVLKLSAQLTENVRLATVPTKPASTDLAPPTAAK